MSSAVKADQSGPVWMSQDDIVKDLASLNVFGIPGDTEPYKVLYSCGRGSKVKSEWESPEKFYDSRTGEVIDIRDTEFNVFNSPFKNIGRGRRLGSNSIRNFQLQQQLRQVRPLGSGDEVIESHCRRNVPRENPNRVSHSSPHPQNERMPCKNALLRFDNKKQRIKGVRNSVLQHNILINTLLSKAKENTDARVNVENQRLSNSNKDYRKEPTSEGSTASFSLGSNKDFPPLNIY